MPIKLIAAIFVPAIIGIGFLAMPDPENKTNLTNNVYIVELKDDGFYPMEITVQKGDSVKFISDAYDYFWPASDPHPTHEFLGGFDPETAIERGESWAYTFNETGSWNYHDHIHVSFKGTINVVSNSSQQETSLTEDCESVTDENKKAYCWYEAIKDKAKNQSIDAAFSLFTKVYAEGAPLGCHWTSHLIGEEAFKKFIEGERFQITNATSYCGYGFYHGFMEPLLRKNPDTKLAIDFCEEVARQLGDDGRNNCYHGIGHGFSEDPPPAETFGNANLMARPGLSVCEGLFEKVSQRYLETCATGVYTVVAHFIEEGLYGLEKLDHHDPFKFCRTQPKKYEVACHGEFAPKLDLITNWDVSKVPSFIGELEDVYTKEIVIRGAVGAMMQRDVAKKDHTAYILGCRTFPEDLRIICLKGIVWGFMMHGLPEQEYIKLLKFCESPMTKVEENFCYTESFSRFKAVYAPGKFQTICSLDDKYKEYCNTANEN
ncbi:MAG: hypothetical protein HYS87_00720 [Candidatus Colwellbacteria bacterium]|nr:hypothetical protein [Candidatus Colwellbacteria bacterium]